MMNSKKAHERSYKFYNLYVMNTIEDSCKVGRCECRINCNSQEFTEKMILELETAGYKAERKINRVAFAENYIVVSWY